MDLFPETFKKSQRENVVHGWTPISLGIEFRRLCGRGFLHHFVSRRAPLFLTLVSLLLWKVQVRGVRCTHFGLQAPSHEQHFGDHAAPAYVESPCSTGPCRIEFYAPFFSASLLFRRFPHLLTAVGTAGRLFGTRHSRVNQATARSRSSRRFLRPLTPARVEGGMAISWPRWRQVQATVC